MSRALRLDPPHQLRRSLVAGIIVQVAARQADRGRLPNRQSPGRAESHHAHLAGGIAPRRRSDDCRRRRSQQKARIARRRGQAFGGRNRAETRERHRGQRRGHDRGRCKPVSSGDWNSCCHAGPPGPQRDTRAVEPACVEPVRKPLKGYRAARALDKACAFSPRGENAHYISRRPRRRSRRLRETGRVVSLRRRAFRRR
jgi:hypothetical protein